MLTQAPKGTKDVRPNDAYKWHYVENIMKEAARVNGYREVRTPGFEHTELFLRGVGDTTDVVQKEMYTFLDKGDRSITLKPEGTAGAARAFIEHGLFNEALPLKMFYFTPVYRYEKPQSGRLREHHQFGVEAFGGSEPTLDAEIIMLGYNVLKNCGLQGLSLNINSIGCPKCRERYNQALREYFAGKKLCETCLSRLERNPMRILDCKDVDCGRDADNAPVILDYICEECAEHFEMLKKILTSLEIPFNVNPRIVRGLDYYTKTVFEIIALVDGSPLTVGVEAFGGSEPTLDAEIIMLGYNVLKNCGLQGLSLNINSIGCPKCRERYNQALREYFAGKKLCETCLSRLERNPMRILDCKDVDCGRDADNAPVILDYICEECAEHFEMLKKILTSLEIPFNVNPRIVRGLDYYTKTVFEIIALVDGSPLTVCGGGRYDGLVEQLGGKETCGIGFGMGIERLLILMEEQQLLPEEPELFKVFVVSGASDQERIAAFNLVQKMRANGISADSDHNKRSFKAQFKYAGKQNVSYTVVIGTNELETGKYTLKNMVDGTQQELEADEIINLIK